MEKDILPHHIELPYENLSIGFNESNTMITVELTNESKYSEIVFHQIPDIGVKRLPDAILNVTY